MALGAQPRDLVRLTLLSGVRLTAIGVACGWVVAFAFAQVVRSMLFSTSARDPMVFGVVPAALVAVAALASMAPALRAARVDPVVALRTD
jgi:ABC-type antimicrobial peptide transport system permease subunit